MQTYSGKIKRDDMAENVPTLDLNINIANLQAVYEQLAGLTKAATIKKTEGDNEDRKTLNDYYTFIKEWQYKFKGVYRGDDKDIAAGIAMTSDASKATGKIGDDIMKIMKTGLGIIEDLHARIKQASPLLQSVESLFNLAVQLFFMPLGNKLATVMIPAIMELVDGVMDMWAKIEGMDLGEMLNEMIKTGAEIFGKYFKNLGEELAKQSGLAGSIGKILIALGDFVENDLADLLEIVVKILETVMNNLGDLIHAFIEFKILSLALQAAQVTATIGASLGPIGAIVGGVAGFAAVEGVGNYAYNQSGLRDMTRKMAASGAYVGATEGGKDVTVAEGGEGEFILPESRLQSMMDSVSDRMVDTASAQPQISPEEREREQTINNYFTINGYTDRELQDMIRHTVNEQVSQSKLRSGF